MQFIDMAIESFEFGKKIRIRKMTVDNPDGIVGIKRGNQLISGFLDGDHMSRSDIAGGTNKSEVLHHGYRVNRFGKL
ncbi:hypothetical protein D3C87_1428600 [compost metagenome]